VSNLPARLSLRAVNLVKFTCARARGWSWLDRASVLARARVKKKKDVREFENDSLAVFPGFVVDALWLMCVRESSRCSPSVPRRAIPRVSRGGQPPRATVPVFLR